MNAKAPASYIEFYLEPLAAFLARPEVTDLYINQPGEVWIETLGGKIERFSQPEINEAMLWRLCRQIASQSHQGVSRAYPLLAAVLPDGSRIQVAAPPATRSHMAIAIRRHAAQGPTLASYRPEPPVGCDPARSWDDLRAMLEEQDYPTFLAEAVQRRLNIVISGGTSSGKTTLLNALLQEVPATERLIFIEDTPELRITHDNSVGLVAVRGRQGEAEITADDLLQAALRMRPDRIILGELRGAEAFTFLRAINTGHPGSLTTVHADSPDRAFVQLAMMTLQAGLGLSYADVSALVRAMVDVVVQIERQDGRRVISSVLLR